MGQRKWQANSCPLGCDLIDKSEDISTTSTVEKF
jgi:hypothetical protein